METFSHQVGVPHNCIWLGPNPPSWSTSFWYVPERHRTFNRSQLNQIAPYDEVMQELRSKLMAVSSSSSSSSFNPLHLNISWCPWVYKKEKYHRTLKPHHLHPIRRKMGVRQTQYAHEVEESSRQFRRKLEEIKARQQAERALREEMKEISAAKEFERVMEQYEKQQQQQQQQNEQGQVQVEENGNGETTATTPPPTPPTRTPPPTPTTRSQSQSPERRNQIVNLNLEMGNPNPNPRARDEMTVMPQSGQKPTNSIIKRRNHDLIYPIQFSSKDLIMLHKEWMNYRNNSRCSQDILMVNQMTRSIQIS